ncbi:MAG TPA: DUF72 domain-containing protein, partial [Polyangiaceae bacterium]|nr:DUF72 domain-containing protein [Polyangiaceae bacterium]
KLYVGQAKLVGPLSRYAGRFNLLEVGAEPGRCPRPATLRRWRSEVPKGFVFSVRLGKSVGGFEADSEQALEFGLAAAEALEAKWLLLQTPASLGPGQRNRDRLKKLFERLLTSGRHVAWDPRGVWDEAEILPIISEVEVQWARDASRYPMVEEPLAYARIPALGSASRVGLGLAERAGENLRGFEEVYVVIEGEGAGRAAQIIRDIATAEDDADGTLDDGVEELSTSGPRRTKLAARAGEEDEAGADEESDDGLDGSDEDDSDEDDSDEDDSDEDDSDEDDSDDKPREIDDSDLPWGGPSKKRSR